MERHTPTIREAVVNWLRVTSFSLRAGWALFRHRPLHAEQLLRHAVSLAPQSFRIHVTLGTTLVRLGRIDDARRILAQAGELSPSAFLREDLPLRLREDLAIGSALARVEAPRRRGQRVRPRDPAPARTDFSDGSEWRRLRSMPAISPSDLSKVDLDDLLSRLMPPEVPEHRGDS